jgi:hypothetical protein
MRTDERCFVRELKAQPDSFKKSDRMVEGRSCPAKKRSPAQAGLERGFLLTNNATSIAEPGLFWGRRRPS